MFHLLQPSYRELKKYFARLPSCYFTSCKNIIFPDVAYFTVHTVRVTNVPPTIQFRASAILLLRQWGVTPMITNFVKICQSFQTFQWRTDTPGHMPYILHGAHTSLSFPVWERKWLKHQVTPHREHNPCTLYRQGPNS